MYLLLNSFLCILCTLRYVFLQIVTADVSELCAESDKRKESLSPPHSENVNSTCSWRGYRPEYEKFWWNGCLCLLIRSFIL